MDDTEIQLDKFLHALSDYSGNEITSYSPFITMQIEQKIKILTDIITLLLTERLYKTES